MQSHSEVRPPDSLVARVQRLVAPLRPLAWTPCGTRIHSCAKMGCPTQQRDLGLRQRCSRRGDPHSGFERSIESTRPSRPASLPEFLGWDGGGSNPVLLLEDLSAAYWPPPWRPGDADLVLLALARVHATPPPDWVPAQDRERLRGWPVVAEDPQPLLSLGLCSEVWLNKALPDLIAVEGAAQIDGDALVHIDVRSDNLCFSGDRVVLVDWNLVARANPLLDVAAWLPSLHSEGGPLPEDILPDEPELAALISGFFASRAGLPNIETAPRVRGVQLDQLRSALPWAVRSLRLPAIG